MSRLLKTQVDVTVDIDWYVFAYPDAQEAIRAGIYRDAMGHYLTVGIRDGRLPTEPDVDEKWYRERYPDVAKAIRHGIIADAKQHYARWGYREGRFPRGGHPGATTAGAPAHPPSQIM
jgi:hypothetical protein